MGNLPFFSANLGFRINTAQTRTSSYRDPVIVPQEKRLLADYLMRPTERRCLLRYTSARVTIRIRILLPGNVRLRP